jgi:hypothetical protein
MSRGISSLQQQIVALVMRDGFVYYHELFAAFPERSKPVLRNACESLVRRGVFRRNGDEFGRGIGGARRKIDTATAVAELSKMNRILNPSL